MGGISNPPLFDLKPCRLLLEVGFDVMECTAGEGVCVRGMTTIRPWLARKEATHSREGWGQDKRLLSPELDGRGRKRFRVATPV